MTPILVVSATDVQRTASCKERRAMSAAEEGHNLRLDAHEAGGTEGRKEEELSKRACARKTDGSIDILGFLGKTPRSRCHRRWKRGENGV